MRSYRRGLRIAVAVGGLSASVASVANAATLYATGDNTQDLYLFSSAGEGTTTLAGTPTSTTANGAYGLAVDSAGDVTTVDYSSSTNEPIYGFSPSGAAITQSSNLAADKAEFAVEYGSNIYVDTSAGSVYTVPDNLASSSSYGAPVLASGITAGSGSAQMALGNVTYFNGTTTVTNTYLYIANTNGTIYTYNLTNNAASGTYSVTSNIAGGYGVWGLAVNSAGNVFIGDTAALKDIYELTPSASDTSGDLTFSTPTAVTSTAIEGVGMTFGPDGGLYVAGYNSHDIYEINADGNGPGALGVLNTYATISGASIYGVAFSPVPEPACLCLLALGAGGMLLRRRNTPLPLRRSAVE